MITWAIAWLLVSTQKAGIRLSGDIGSLILVAMVCDVVMVTVTSAIIWSGE